MKNGKDKLDKFDAKANGGILLGYFSYSKVYRVFNNITCVIEESLHIVFHEIIPKETEKGSSSFDVSVVLTEDLVKNDDSKVGLFKSDGTKDDKEGK